MIASDTSVARVEPGSKGNGLSACEEIYLARYSEAHREFGAASVGANLVDDGTKNHDPYSLPESLTCQKADVLGNMLRPPEPSPPVESVSYSEPAYSESTYTEPTTYGASGCDAGCVQCESGGDPTAVDPSGTYWGLYQYDAASWAADGGDPASYGSASAAEQASVAANAPIDRWPNC